MTGNGAGLRQTSRRPTMPLSACIRGTGSGTPMRRSPFHFHKGALVEPIRHLGRTSQVTANHLVTAAPERNRGHYAICMNLDAKPPGSVSV
jgi:hypothetical protein